MLARSSAEIDSPMDTSLDMEDDMLEIDMNGDIDDNEDIEDQDADADIILLDDKVPEVFNFETDLQDVALPDEVTNYIKSLSSETRKLEDELKECDELLQYSPRKPHVSTAVVLFDDLKDIEEAASAEGMSVEEFQKKVLDDMRQNEFNEDEVDEEYEEFLQLQREFAELRAGLPNKRSDKVIETLAIEGSSGCDGDVGNTALVASDSIEGVSENIPSERDEISGHDATDETKALVKYVDADEVVDNDLTEVGQVALNMAALTSMRDFILEQLRRNEEFYERKRQDLVQSIETLRHEEEKEMLRTEQRRKKVEDEFKEEEEELRQRKELNDAQLEEEMRVRMEQTTQELSEHQVEIDRLSEALEEERHQFEISEKQWRDRLAETRGKAALKIQKVYRGLRTRRQHTTELAELTELRELRVKEKHTLRLMELEYEIKLRDEETKKSKEEAEEKRKREEEERQKEKERKEKEEAERIASLIQKEKDRMEEEAKQAEIKRKKEEEEEQRKVEEKKRKEEEKKRKEEEKRQKEEEKKKQKEEERQRKEDEKRKKEDEKKKKEEEKKMKEEEKRKQKQEEKVQKDKSAIVNVETKSDQLYSNNVESKKIYENFISHKSVNSTESEKRVENGHGRESPRNTLPPPAKTTEDITTGAVDPKTHAKLAETDSELASPTASAQSAKTEEKTPSFEQKPTSLKTTALMPQPPAQSQQKQPTDESASTAPKSPGQATAATAATAATIALVETHSTTAAATIIAPVETHLTTAVASKPAELHSITTTAAVSPSDPPPQEPVLVSEPPPPKPSAAELQRLAWIKSCIPWSKVSNEPWKLSQTAAKVHKKPASAKKLPAVSEAVVLAAAHAETLRQVSSVMLYDLPGCSLSTLGQCWSLRYLTVTRCGLLCLDGLSQCRHLLYVNAEHNLLEYVDLKDLGSLQVARLAHNNLGSVHGLEGCINLRWMDLSHNSITRIGTGLTPLRRLHTLDLSHNQLVSGQGLESVVTCQRLVLDHNYLQGVQCLDKMCLLTELSLAGNNLLKVPDLKNQVLLQTLNINENSIKSLESLRNSWLPLLHTVTCEKNLLESCEGLDMLDLLEVLDVGSNQITDLESLTTHLCGKQYLSRLVVKGNPLVDVYSDQYSTKLADTLPALRSVDGQQVKPGGASDLVKSQTDEWRNTEFLHMCLSQSGLHKQLKVDFDANLQTLLSNKSATSETLCGTYFSFCDTSFKMASEHRSAHEYGDMSVSRSIGHFEPSNHTVIPTPTAVPKSAGNSSVGGCYRDEIFSGQKSKVGSGGGQSILDKKALFDQAVSGQNTPGSSVSVSGALSARSSQGNFVLDQTSSPYGMRDGTDRHNEQQVLAQSQKSGKLSSQKRKERQAQQGRSSLSSHSKSQSKTGAHVSPTKSRTAVLSSGSSSDSDSDNESMLLHSTSGEGGGGSARTFGNYSHVPHPPAMPAVAYVNEKDKFEMAINKSSATNKIPNNSQASKNGQSALIVMSEKDRFEMALKTTASTSDVCGRDKFELALQGSAQSRHAEAKEKFNGALQQGVSEGSVPFQRSGMPVAGVPADVVGSQLAERNGEFGEDFDLAALGLDGEFDLDNLDFDIDKYLDLDMDDLDEFLEKGWRPEDSPQIPHSNYPVLGKINSAGDSSQPSSSLPHTIDNHRHIAGAAAAAVQGRPPAVPPHHPTLAWRNSPSAELRGRPLQSPLSGGVRALPTQPSPSPSSVASAAETLGGGTVKSKKDELVDEWGFKDSRTAEMMMARAKKMKWNAERRKKLSKLDPQQRLHLFRKLEESGKVQPVRAPPARVLPRKEYFQARKDEANRQHQERRVEEQTKVHRTYEWLHTQVGDHPIASSRINAGQAPVYSTNEAGPARHMAQRSHQENRRWSPGSDHLDSVSQADGSRPRQGRRYSIGDSQYSGQTPSLPPIQVGSAPSSQKGERISFRDTPVERSGGWGGGKRRGQYK